MANEYPNAIEMEKKLLSAMMLKGGAIVPEVVEILKASDLYRAEHQMIFSAIVAVADTGIELDVTLVQSELEKRKQLEKIKLGYLLSLIDYEYTTGRATTYAREIKDKAQKRKLIQTAKALAQKAMEDVLPADEILTQAVDDLQSTVNISNRNAEKISSILSEVYDELSMIRRGDKALIGVKTGLYGLDKATNGFKKSNMIILAARPSMGKTALALNIAANASMKNPTLIFSLEMSKGELGRRFLSAESRIHATRIQSGDLTDNEMSILLDTAAFLSERQLVIDDTAGLTLPEIRARARSHKSKHGLGLIVIDYIQLIQGGREYRGNRVQEVSEISRGIKALARELDVPILALSQLSRNVELRADKRPQLSDLRESGSLEQDADIVMFLYRDEYYNRDENRDETENRNVAELIIAKNRNGQTATIPLQFEKQYMLFGDLVRKG